MFEKVLNDMFNSKLDTKTPAVVLTTDQFLKTKDNTVAHSGHCRVTTDDKIDICFYDDNLIHIGENLKSICFSELFDLAIDEIKNHAFLLQFHTMKLKLAMTKKSQIFIYQN